MPDEGARPLITAAVEGVTDEAVAARLIEHAGGWMKGAYGKIGKSYLRQRIVDYDNAAHRALWFLLVDLDDEKDCAPLLREAWLPEPAPRLCFRVAVRAVEAWLMADAETLAGYLGVSQNRIPARPEELRKPKDAMVDLARRSRRKDIREDMAPREGSGRRVGPAYPGRLIDYAAHAWRPEVASRRSESLRRAIGCLRRLVGQGADLEGVR